MKKLIIISIISCLNANFDKTDLIAATGAGIVAGATTMGANIAFRATASHLLSFVSHELANPKLASSVVSMASGAVGSAAAASALGVKSAALPAAVVSVLAELLMNQVTNFEDEQDVVLLGSMAAAGLIVGSYLFLKVANRVCEKSV